MPRSAGRAGPVQSGAEKDSITGEKVHILAVKTEGVERAVAGQVASDLAEPGSRAGSPRSGACINRVEVFLLESRLRPPRAYSQGDNSVRAICLVRLEDSRGAVGWGESPVRPGAFASLQQAGTRLLGQDPLGDGTARFIAGVADSYARSACSIALDDLRGQLLGLPIHRLYGDETVRRVRAYAASPGYVAGEDPVETWDREVSGAARAGFVATKLRVGGLPWQFELDQLAALRSARPDARLIADANEAYTVPVALEVAGELARLGFEWLEEPVAIGAYELYPGLAAGSELAIAGGEQLADVARARELVRDRAFDIVQPDVTICGGIGDALQIMRAARAAGIDCVPHSCNGAIGTAATLQLLALRHDSATARESWLEWDASGSPHMDQLLLRPLVVSEQGLEIPSMPGLGVAVNETYVRSQAVATRVLVNP